MPWMTPQMLAPMTKAQWHRHIAAGCRPSARRRCCRRGRERVGHQLLLGNVDPDRQHLLVVRERRCTACSTASFCMSAITTSRRLRRARCDTETTARGGAADDGWLVRDLNGP